MELGSSGVKKVSCLWVSDTASGCESLVLSSDQDCGQHLGFCFCLSSYQAAVSRKTVSCQRSLGVIFDYSKPLDLRN